MQHRRIIKQGPVVLATREDGSMDPSSPSSQGLFMGDTRYLSRFQIRLNDTELVLLGSTEEILFQTSVLQTNPELTDIPARGIGVLQRSSIADGAVKVVITVANWALKPIEVEVSIELDADYFDSFEARGVKRLKRGTIEQPCAVGNCLEMSYLGLDRVQRKTRIATTPPFSRHANDRLYFPLSLGVNERKEIVLDMHLTQTAPQGVSLEPEPAVSKRPTPPWFGEASLITTNNARIEAILERSTADLEVLLTEYWHLFVPAAGLPRFAVPFGRDCLITGLETLVWNHHLSRSVLCFLAKTQGTQINEWTYEQPGKIMHEMHTGELARLREIPFGLFYGSVDSTPLFLVLGAEYIRWTGDLALYHELKSHFQAAWQWIDDYGDIDGSGYVQYQAHTPPKMSTAALTVGLFNQGWKDSANAVVYSNGEIVTDHPIALAEVQGDLYRALVVWSQVYLAMPESEGMREEGLKLAERARRLKERFNREFWMSDKEYYAMALDGHHRPVDSITSNPAQCLWARLIEDEHVEPVVKTLMSDAMLTAWGIRTMASTERAYNPFSYHDGSVWPFEQAIIASGLKKYGCLKETQQIFDAMIDASLYFEYRRWPEVYCGVSKNIGGVLARQPDASRPQAWSSGAIFLFMQTILGIAPRPFSKTVDITPALPGCLNEVVVQNLSIAGATLSLRVKREGNGILMEIMDNPDDLDIIIHPATRNHHHLIGDEMPAVSR